MNILTNDSIRIIHRTSLAWILCSASNLLITIYLSHLSLEKELNTLFGRIWYLYVLLQINELT